jgi:hypothetical protein
VFFLSQCKESIVSFGISLAMAPKMTINLITLSIAGEVAKLIVHLICQPKEHKSCEILCIVCVGLKSLMELVSTMILRKEMIFQKSKHTTLARKETHLQKLKFKN